MGLLLGTRKPDCLSTHRAELPRGKGSGAWRVRLTQLSPAGLQGELARARQATRCCREVLFRYPDSRKDLRQVSPPPPPPPTPHPAPFPAFRTGFTLLPAPSSFSERVL